MPFRVLARISSTARFMNFFATARWTPQAISIRVSCPPSNTTSLELRQAGRFARTASLFSGTMKALRQSLGTTTSSGVPSANARLGSLPFELAPCRRRPIPYRRGQNSTTARSQTAGLCVDNNVAKYLPFFHMPNGAVSGDIAQYVFVRQPVVSENYLRLVPTRRFPTRTAFSAPTL